MAHPRADRDDAVWRRPSGRPSLRPDDVHLWVAELDGAGDLVDVLSPDELERAERYRHPTDRARFVACRGVLRGLLASYLDRSPRAVRFAYGRQGKPTLDMESSTLDLRFNASRRGNLALYAVASGRDVGVDLEPVDPTFATREVAERFFSPREVEALRALPEVQQTEAFFHCWTRKEAYLKALGTGLSIPLDSFDVSLAPGAPPAILDARGAAAAATHWSVHALDPAPGIVGALAVESGPTRLACWRWARATPARTEGVLA